MNVTLEKSFTLPGSAEVAWQILCDIEAVASCMPGARITERIDVQHYKGTVSVKFGPASMSFRGEIEVKALDAASCTLVLLGKGTDSTGSSGASMELCASIAAMDGDNCTLYGNSTVSVSGKAASFGGRMMGSVADQVLKQFAANFGARVARLQALNGALGSTAASGPRDASGTSGLSMDKISGGTPVAAAGLSVMHAPIEPSQLHVFSLLWGMIRDGFKSLFASGRK
ncbi:MAG: SRPBCC family protein [Burkholderiaceae bacterium]